MNTSTSSPEDGLRRPTSVPLRGTKLYVLSAASLLDAKPNFLDGG
ncbi:hypothetical protein [Streptomyces sp. NPDC056479]